jgi:hypothetical protein
LSKDRIWKKYKIREEKIKTTCNTENITPIHKIKDCNGLYLKIDCHTSEKQAHSLHWYCSVHHSANQFKFPFPVHMLYITVSWHQMSYTNSPDITHNYTVRALIRNYFPTANTKRVSSFSLETSKCLCHSEVLISIIITLLAAELCRSYDFLNIFSDSAWPGFQSYVIILKDNLQIFLQL